MSNISKIKLSFKKTLLLALITYLFYWIGYGVSLIFHDPYIPTHGGPPDFSFIDYLYYSFVGFISLAIITLTQDSFQISWVALVLHILLFCLFIYDTQFNFSYRPYEHLLFSVILGSTIITRPLIDFLLNKYYFTCNAQ